jgi:hypothetical protein
LVTAHLKAERSKGSLVKKLYYEEKIIETANRRRAECVFHQQSMDLYTVKNPLIWIFPSDLIELFRFATFCGPERKQSRGFYYKISTRSIAHMKQISEVEGKPPRRL